MRSASARLAIVVAGVLLSARRRPHDDEDQQGKRYEGFEREDEHRILVEKI
ncbi:hypothetical protein BSLA_01r5567 [Burkholderia stabilis]|nr:hypothetical protein BSLA_01r5567 [Burkholderia stabilis]